MHWPFLHVSTFALQFIGYKKKIECLIYHNFDFERFWLLEILLLQLIFIGSLNGNINKCYNMPIPCVSHWNVINFQFVCRFKYIYPIGVSKCIKCMSAFKLQRWSCYHLHFFPFILQICFCPTLFANVCGCSSFSKSHSYTQPLLLRSTTLIYLRYCSVCLISSGWNAPNVQKKGQQAYEHTWTNNQYECIHNAYI